MLQLTDRAIEKVKELMDKEQLDGDELRRILGAKTTTSSDAVTAS